MYVLEAPPPDGAWIAATGVALLLAWVLSGVSIEGRPSAFERSG